MLKLLELISCELLRVKIVKIIKGFAHCVLCKFSYCGYPVVATCCPLPLCPALSLQLINDFCTFWKISRAWNSIVANTSTGLHICRVATKIGFASQLRKRGREGGRESKSEIERDSKLTCACIVDFLSSCKEIQRSRINSEISAWLLCLSARGSPPPPPPSSYFL